MLSHKFFVGFVAAVRLFFQFYISGIRHILFSFDVVWGVSSWGGGIPADVNVSLGLLHFP